ncbi:MAG TPA: cupin domain-containing protein [Gammaproteobacteria bacterium]|nr:cupin domain-containing protein [Gammaproteobacteria bacterium]
MVILPAGDDLDTTIRFFIDDLGFRLDSIGPADAPAYARLSGHGLHLQLEKAEPHDPGTVRIAIREDSAPRTLTAPNGTRIEFVPADPALIIPPPAPRASLQSAPTSGSAWTRGRAGMLYRDLVPDRAGGYLIASHIRIPEGGPVPDNVHHHAINFQFIYCRRGWVRLVYEDQGEPFVLEAGDCVLQPPHIRHRVLETSDGLEVIELASPATHETWLDHDMQLPTGHNLPERDYSGQTFVLHKANEARWEPRSGTGIEARDIGLKQATGSLVDAHVLRCADDGRSPDMNAAIKRSGALAFLFVLCGSLHLALDDQPEAKMSADSVCVLPTTSQVRLTQCTRNFELLEVVFPMA